MARSRQCLCFLLVLQRLTETISIPSNSSEHVEAVLPAPPRLASLAETAKEIERIKQKIHGDYVTYINGRKVVVMGDSRKADIAMCVFSSLLATHQLASAGMSINGAVATCGWGGMEEKTEACVANIGNTLATLSGTAAFLTELALNCPTDNVNWRAGCAAPIATLLSGLGGLVGHSAGVSQACDAEKIENGATIFNPVSVDDESGMANCILNADQAAFFAGRAGLNVNALANGDCSGQNSKAGCSASVTGALTSFASMASFLAGAVSKCTMYKIYSPACAANIAGLVADLNKVANFASDMANNKCKAPKGDYFSPNTIYWNPAGSNRRLGENVSFVDESVIEQPFHI